MLFAFVVFLEIYLLSQEATAFVALRPGLAAAVLQQNPPFLLQSSPFNDNAAERTEAENILAQNYPSFFSLVIQPSEEVVKTLRRNANIGFTLFCPNQQAFANLGEKKCAQLADPRNLETVEKIAAYHTIGDELVTAETLASDAVGGVMTMAGPVDVGPSQSGGLFGFGAQNDGGTAIGPGARILASFPVQAGVIHEVDGLVSPSMLWSFPLPSECCLLEMGCLCSKGLTTAVQIEIPTSSDVVWSVVTDIEALPETSPFVHSVEIVDKDENESASSTICVVGRKWREKRAKGNEEVFEQIKTILRIEEEPHRSLSVDVSFPTSGTSLDLTNTCSWTVIPVNGKETVLICSIAFESAEGTENLCRCLLLRYAEKYLLEELQGYKEAALKR